MTTVPHPWPHRHREKPLGGDLRPTTVLSGLLALVALTALIGGLAGAVTWAVVWLFAFAVG